MNAIRGAGASERELREIERSVIVSKALENVKDHADYQRVVRVSPKRYSHVQSKVARCLKVQSNATKRTRKVRQDSGDVNGPIYVQYR
jgi:hypothetical protein